MVMAGNMDMLLPMKQRRPISAKSCTSGWFPEECLRPASCGTSSRILRARSTVISTPVMPGRL